MPHAKPPRRPSNALRRSIAVALGVALIGASTLAGAETAKEKELEARVAELEKLVQQLVAEKKFAPAPVAHLLPQAQSPPHRLRRPQSRMRRPSSRARSCRMQPPAPVSC